MEQIAQQVPVIEIREDEIRRKPPTKFLSYAAVASKDGESFSAAPVSAPTASPEEYPALGTSFATAVKKEPKKPDGKKKNKFVTLKL
jgi:hypothetical protein